jgi:hypothetical protein
MDMLPDIANLSRAQLVALLIVIGGRLAEESEPLTPAALPQPEPDEMLTTEEAAAMLRRSPRWIYRNADKLPFVKHLSKRSMVHSRKGIERYLATRR